MGVIRRARDATLASMSKDELVFTGRLVAATMRARGDDPNPMATTDLIVALTDRLENSRSPEED